MKKPLIVGVIILLITMGLTPSTETKSMEQSFQSTLESNTLYVGGSGPGNYTKIQDAIDDANNGDTVFVYNGTYVENVIINVSINLRGEDGNTTVIDGMKIDDTLWIKTSFVNVSGFTIFNSLCDGWHSGIFVVEKKWWPPDDPHRKLTNINIFGCIIKNNDCGIWLVNTYAVNISFCIINNNPALSIYLTSSSQVNIDRCEINHNGDIYPGAIVICEDDRFGISENITISNCSISNNMFLGLWIMDSSRNIEIRYNNIFENTNHGIDVFESDVNIYGNHIFDNGMGVLWNGGIYLQDCINCITIKENDIASNNPYGLYLMRSSGNSFIKNNFVNNRCNAFFSDFSFFNHWNRNYWTDWWGLGPKLIRGEIGILSLPWVNFDWHPAREPYDIGV